MQRPVTEEIRDKRPENKELDANDLSAVILSINGFHFSDIKLC